MHKSDDEKHIKGAIERFISQFVSKKDQDKLCDGDCANCPDAIQIEFVSLHELRTEESSNYDSAFLSSMGIRP